MIDVTDPTFQTDVLEESNRRPVVVDLWSPRSPASEPQAQMLAQIVAETGGKVLLARVNVDENPQIAQAFQVQTIPVVFALHMGQIVGNLDGPRPENEVRNFVNQLLPSADEVAIDDMIAAGDELGMTSVLEQQPGNAKVIVALATIYVDSKRHDEALELLARIPETEEVRLLAARARTGVDDQTAETAELEQKLEALLPKVKDDDEARQEFVDLLAVMGATNPATAAWRKRLTTQLF